MDAPAESGHRALHGLRFAFTVVAAAVAALHLAVLAALFALRVAYPFDIEWLEGGMLLHAWRLREGLALYGPPSAEFIPFNYTPLQPWLVAAVSCGLFLPVGYALARVLSVAACLAAGWAVARVVRREGGGAWDVLCALAVAAGGFAFSGAWMDLVRVDSLCLALVLGGFLVLRVRGGERLGAAAGATLLAAAFFAKQSAAVFLPAGALALALTSWRRLPLYLATAGGVLGAGLALLEWRSAGWFRRWIFAVPAGHALERDVLLGRAWERMLDHYWPVALLVTAALYVALRQPGRRRGLLFWLLFGASSLATSALGASIRLAYLNAYLPAVWAAAVLAGVSAATLRGASPPVLRLGVPVLLTLQLALSVYDPRPHVPGPNRARAERFVARLRAIPGEILVPYHPFAAVQAGKAPSFHVMAMGAARHGGLAPPADLDEAIAAQRYAAIVLDRRPEHAYWQSYKLGAFLPEEDSPLPLTGFMVRPRYVLVPKRVEPAPAGTVPLVDFESGGWEGWAVSGDAFGPAPAGGPTRFQGPVGPFGGLFLANSSHPTAAAMGRALSPEFTIPSSRLQLRVGGGAAPRLAARLLVDGSVVQSAVGSGDDELRAVEWPVVGWVGRRARLELVDEDPVGYLLVDDLVAR